MILCIKCFWRASQNQVCLLYKEIWRNVREKIRGVPLWEVVCIQMHLSFCSLFVLLFVLSFAIFSRGLLHTGFSETRLSGSKGYNSQIFYTTAPFCNEKRAIAASAQFMYLPCALKDSGASASPCSSIVGVQGHARIVWPPSAVRCVVSNKLLHLSVAVSALVHWLFCLFT